MREIRTCQAMLEAKAETMIDTSSSASPRWSGAAASPDRKYGSGHGSGHTPKGNKGLGWWIFLLTEYSAIRHCCVLPLVIATVPVFSLGMGMDALSVALNSMAVLVRARRKREHHSTCPTSLCQRLDYIESHVRLRAVRVCISCYDISVHIGG